MMRGFGCVTGSLTDRGSPAHGPGAFGSAHRKARAAIPRRLAVCKRLRIVAQASKDAVYADKFEVCALPRPCGLLNSTEMLSDKVAPLQQHKPQH